MPPPNGTNNPLQGPGDYTTTQEVHSDTYPAIDPTKADLTGKAIYINGASRGIGKAVALSFAKAGTSSIAISARSDLTEVEKEIEQVAKDAGRSAPKVLRLKVDVTDPTSVQKLAGEIEKAFGKLDVVINSAGILGDRTNIIDGDADNWWYLWSLNIHGPYLVTKYCMPLLLKGDLKTVINLSSVGAHLVVPGLSDYQPSKLALVRFTEFIAAEHADDGFIAFSIHPGNCKTDILGDFDAMPDTMKPIFVDTPELCGDTLVFLAKGRYQWLSGRYINVTWDMPELVSAAKQKQIVDGDMLKVRLVVP